MVQEAKLENGVPQTAGWFVVNARDASWVHNEMGWYCNFFHCPPQTKHTVVGTGDTPCLVLAVGARKGRASYPYDEAAARHGAGLETAEQHPREAYARFGELEPSDPPELF